MKEEKLGILLTSYMCHCQFEKALNTHTLKAYRRDLKLRTPRNPNFLIENPK